MTLADTYIDIQSKFYVVIFPYFWQDQHHLLIPNQYIHVQVPSEEHSDVLGDLPDHGNLN